MLMSGFEEALIILVSYLVVLAVVLLDLEFELGMRREILLSSVLSLLQLAGVGFLILFLSKLQLRLVYPLFVLLFYANASLISTRRFTFRGYSRKNGLLVSFTAIAFVSTLSLLFLYIEGVLKMKASSIIPLAGIVTAAGMRSLSLAFKHYRAKLKDTEDILLGMLALGASDVTVFKFIYRELINDITVPVRDMLRSAGIVHIPGVMVGLLLAGALPFKAVVVQFAVLTIMVFQFVFVPTIALFALVSTKGLRIER
jgi:putative ABC transport system permease protein